VTASDASTTDAPTTTATTTRFAGAGQDLVRTMWGGRAAWRLVPPTLSLPRPSISWLGTVIVIASVGVSWFAFDSADGRGSVAFGLFIGATAILLMSWSFLLAVRLPIAESLFGGLDRAYRVHRWAGALAVVAMFLHIRVEPDIRGGIRGASRSVADVAEELAGLAEIALYVLVSISIVRWVPYRWWRHSHKLLGVPYLFACFHFVTAEKPYANGSAWGWWFGAWMAIGTVAWLFRIVVRDALRPGTRCRVTSAVTTGTTLDLRLSPADGRPLRHRPGQFAFVKLQVPGMREPHPFTIASPPGATELRFLVRALGDWSNRLQHTDGLVDQDVIVEGPYGRFRPLDGDGRQLWIAGGVGITPFLAAIGSLPAPEGAAPPTLAYCVRRRADAMALSELEAAAAEGRVRLSMHVSDEGTRLDPTQLAALVGASDLRGVDVSVCGPHALVAAVVHAARRLHARHVHTEDFDIRQGIGPDLSVPIDAQMRRRRRAPASD
jgi:predicted ferric reductase